MVAGIRFVASGGDGTARIERPGVVGQFLGEKRVDTHLPTFGGEFVLAVAEIEYEVGFLEREGVG